MLTGKFFEGGIFAFFVIFDALVPGGLSTVFTENSIMFLVWEFYAVESADVGPHGASLLYE